jgi:Zn-dependent M28 family amino/carboxypeptidase
VRKLALGGVAVLAAAALLSPTQATAIDEVNTLRLRNAVTVNGILQHERAFQRIANNNGGTRASGTPGYDASADYVAQRLRRAGYSVRTQTFDFEFFQNLAPGELEEISPTARDIETGTFDYSGSGEVTGRLVPIDVTFPATTTPSSNSGCEPGDFPAPPAEPAVALIQRGTCDFAVKAANAAAAGYEAAIIFNEGNPGRTELFIGTLGSSSSIPVVGASYEDAEDLYTESLAGPVVVRVETSTESEVRETVNVLADSKRGKKDEVVVVGAHLDSVLEGPGINDNGSGSSTILEIAEEMAELGYNKRDRLQRQIRFAFWGAEENNLLGSQYYVDQLNNRQFARHYANLNFDMLGSPNYVRFVYDGDGSDTPLDGPPGSAQIEDIFNDYFASQNLETEPTAFDGRSDYGPFIEAGIPAGGLFSGAEGIKTARQARIYGGTAGEQYDPCYHEACDDITNLSTKALFELGDAAAHATLTLALSRTGFFEDGSRVGSRAANKVKLDARGHTPIK